MGISKSPVKTMRALRFHTFGEPNRVLKLEHIPVPNPGADRIRIRVHACGLNPADWALCRGLFPGLMPRGIGLDISGIVDAIGEGVMNAAIGDRVFGTADFAGSTSAGASDYAIMDHWAEVPPTLGMIEAASLPMAVSVANAHLNVFGQLSNKTLLIHGGGTVMGFAAVQIALMRGARVITTAGAALNEQLRAFGAAVTAYGSGMAERVREIAKGSPDFVLDAGPVSGVLPDLVKIAGGDPNRVLTMSDFTSAKELGVRETFGAQALPRYDLLGEFAQLAAAKRFTVPIARTFTLEDWRPAMDISAAGKAQGKLILLVGQ